MTGVSLWWARERRAFPLIARAAQIAAVSFLAGLVAGVVL